MSEVVSGWDGVEADDVDNRKLSNINTKLDEAKSKRR